MKTKKYEKKTIVTHAYCDCGGEFVYDTTSLFFDMIVSKNGLEHTCNKCGKREVLDKMYPDEEVVEVKVK